MPEASQAYSPPINPHVRSTGVRSPHRVEPLLGHSPDSMPDKYPPHRWKWPAAHPRTASRGEHDRIAVVAEQRGIRFAGDSLHDHHAVDRCTRVNRISADYPRRGSGRKSQRRDYTDETEHLDERRHCVSDVTTLDRPISIGSPHPRGARKPHMTRHTFATDVLEATEGDLYAVTELLGHTSTRVTEVYLHSSRTRTASAMEALAEYRRSNSKTEDD